MAILGQEVPKEFDDIYAGITGLLERNKENPDTRALNAWLTVCKGLVEGLLQAAGAGAPMMYANLGNTPELIMALGDGKVVPLGFEALGGLQGWFGNNQHNMDVIDLVEASGLAADVCSADKLALGYMLKKLTPPPVGAVFVNTPCDNQMVAAGGVKALTGVETFIVDIPYNTGDREIRFVAGQLKDQIKYMERMTGKKLDWDRLKAICEESNRMVELLLEWSEWRKKTPCPQMSKIVTFGFIILNTLSGTSAGTWLASELLEDAKERVQAGKKAVPGEEKVRAVWFHDPIWWNLPFYDWMEEELGMVVPMDLFGYLTSEAYIDTSSSATILYSLARKLSRVMPMSRQFKGAAEVYIDDLISVVHEFRADCAIFAGHLGCKHAWGLIGLLKEALREADIPLLSFAYDMFDPRVTSEETLKEEFRRFTNDIMLPRKSR
jgi:benzoyl-CoA reductase/2-hydroxyglutaryl-CoA dehydratase subunit BcrC/BadD/HgdB